MRWSSIALGCAAVGITTLAGIFWGYCPLARRSKKYIPSLALSRPSRGVLLVQLGTPDNTSVSAVRRYLREFLMDGRVIDIPFWQRFLLVNGIIAPFRAPASAKSYVELWQHHGGRSPLKEYGYALTKAVQDRFKDNDTVVAFGMRYQNPSIESALQYLKDAGVKEIVVLPLFAQYASSSSGSALQAVMYYLSHWDTIPSVRTISSFIKAPLYIEAIAAQARPVLAAAPYDRVLMSFHGIPRRQAQVSCAYCQAGLDSTCAGRFDAVNRLCYRAQCYETARCVAADLKLPEAEYQVMFQSRLGRAEWLKPYAAEVVEALPKQGVTRVVALSLSFVADCLETTMEVGEEYKELFEEHGGKEWRLVPSLNVTEKWVDCVYELVK